MLNSFYFPFPPDAIHFWLIVSVTKLMSTLISAQKLSVCIAIYISTARHFSLIFSTRIYLITALCCLASTALNLLRFYYSPDFGIIKNILWRIFSSREAKRLFPVRRLLTHWGEMLILAIIYTHAESAGKLTEKRKKENVTFRTMWML